MKAFFLSRLFREKLLLAGLILFVAIAWLSGLSRRANAFTQTFSRTTSILEDQKHWLDQRDAILVRSRAAAESFDPSRTFDDVRLQAEMDQIARNLGVSNTSGEVLPTEQGSELSMNSVQFTIRNTDYATLVRFYQEVSKRAPYIGLEQFRVQANAANSAQLNATIRVSSVSVISR